MILLKGGLILDDNKLKKRDVLIDNDKIVQIAESIDVDAVSYDVGGKWVIPGGVDVHVHFREPGYEHKETIKSGSQAAAKGGITCVMPMGNVKAVPHSLENLQIQFDIINRDAKIRVYPYGAVTSNRLGCEVVDFANLKNYVKGFSDDGDCINDLSVLEKALVGAKENSVIIASHSEAKGFDDLLSEIEAVKRELKLVEKTRAKYHFCHLSQYKSISLVREAAARGVDVSYEVTPHHLVFNSADVQDTNFKMSPPLRDEKDRKAVEEALLSDKNIIVATDHAPHTKEEKAVAFEDAPNGVIGLETFLPVIYTYFVKSGKASYADMLNWCVFNPAKRFDLPHGEIKIGALADIAVLDIENAYVVSEFVSKSQNSPFINQKLFGCNTLTLVGGRVVYNKFEKIAK